MLLPPTPGKLSPDLFEALQRIGSMRLFPRGAMLFEKGSIATGVYLVETGEVRVLLPTVHSNLQLLEVIGSGGILGLSESISGQNYRVSAEASDDTRAVFLDRDRFREFLCEHIDSCMQVVRLLSQDLHGIYYKFRSISAHPGRPRQRALDEQLN